MPRQVEVHVVGQLEVVCLGHGPDHWDDKAVANVREMVATLVEMVHVTWWPPGCVDPSRTAMWGTRPHIVDTGKSALP